MKRIILIVVLMLILISLASLPDMTQALVSPLPTPTACPPMRWCEEPNVAGAMTLCWRDGTDWRLADFTAEPWLHVCQASAPPSPFDSPVDPTPIPTPCPRPGMWRADDWMGQYPLWTDGTRYCVAE